MDKYHVDCPTTSPVQAVVNSINSDPDALEILGRWIPDCALHVLFVSQSSIVLKAGADKIIKIYSGASNSKLQAGVEWLTYQDIGHLENVPKTFDHHESKTTRFIIMEYVGRDAMEIVINEGINYKMWSDALRELGVGLNAIHRLSKVHGDIKLENMTFNGLKWFFIDFGFGYTNCKTVGKYSGTFPNILPVYGFKSAAAENEKLGMYSIFDRRKVADIYAFALTFLSISGFHFIDKCIKCYEEGGPLCLMCSDMATPSKKMPMIAVDISSLYKYRVSNTTAVANWGNHPWGARAIRLLIDIVFTQLDPRCDQLVWNKNTHTCTYKGHNPSFNLEEYTPHEDTFSAWGKFQDHVCI